MFESLWPTVRASLHFFTMFNIAINAQGNFQMQMAVNGTQMFIKVQSNTERMKKQHHMQKQWQQHQQRLQQRGINNYSRRSHVQGSQRRSVPALPAPKQETRDEWRARQLRDYYHQMEVYQRWQEECRTNPCPELLNYPAAKPLDPRLKPGFYD